MSVPFRLTNILVATLLVLCLSSCQVLSKLGLAGKKGEPGQPGGAPQPGGQAAPRGQVPVSGYWQVAFQLGDKTMKANMRLQQNGNEFTGDGTDDPSGREFVVEEGVIDTDASVHFFKRYPGGDAASSPAVEYAGKLEMVTEGDMRGPYMSGEYATTYQGNQIHGIWEGQMTQNADGGPPPGAEPPAGQAPPPGQEGQPGGGPPQPAQPVDPSRAPHLSGKWQAAYEYKFKTIKSTMYLEQDGGKLRGHGEDKNTKEKFIIEKGWYNFPRVTLVRKYVKGKGAAADRTMTFKAEVSLVNDHDYQGPYLSGKTEGGGAWEAQMYK